MPSFPSMTTDPAALNTAYSVSLLTEYANTLDGIPLELAHHFGDLRELDAVLSASVNAMTNKITRLVDMIQNRTGSKDDCLWLLVEISEEAKRLKPGGEDKIRVASQAADALHGHHAHMTSLMQLVPDFDASLLIRKTVYPHVAPKSYAPVSTHEGRRRRSGALLTASADPSGSNNKRKRPVRDDGDELAGGRTPRKDRQNDGGSRPKNGNRNRTCVSSSSALARLLGLRSVIAGAPQESYRALDAWARSRTCRGSSGLNGDCNCGISALRHRNGFCGYDWGTRCESMSVDNDIATIHRTIVRKLHTHGFVASLA